MWIDRDTYMSLNASAAALAADRNRLERRVEELEKEVERERTRAEAALDELVKFATMGRAEPVSGESRQDARKKMDITGMDNIFEEEDPEAVKALHAKIEAGEDILDLYEAE